MGYFTLQFQNKEFEELYQQHLKKCVQKTANYYMIILFIGQCLALIDQFLSRQYYLFMLYCPVTTFEIYMIYLIHKHRLKVEYITMYINLLSLTASSIQLAFYYFNFLDLTNSQYYVYMDIMHQFILLYNFGSSYILSSIFYIYFLIIRVYIQVCMGFTFQSLAFIVYGLFYIIDLYQTEKQHRKQFLKGQRNKLFEQLIQEFIDDQICIIEKDEDNIKFIPVIINNKFQMLSSDINKVIKQINTQYKQSLQNYLYKTNKNKETLLCHYKNQVFQITYWRIIQKKCQIFVKMQQIYNNKYSLVNYKELYDKQQKKLQHLSKQSQQAKQINQYLQASIFIYWFQKYYCQYKCKFELISFDYLEELFRKGQFDINKLFMKPIYSDKQLLRILLRIIEQTMAQVQVRVIQQKFLLEFKFYGKTQITSLNKAIQFINQILFHIGYGKCSIIKNQDESCLIKMKIMNNKHAKFQIQGEE
ncbi:hypothetical protein pb186bvf_019967 [Paramecium bursaria]